MPFVPKWRRHLRFWRADVHADVDDELRFHFDARIGNAGILRCAQDDGGGSAQDDGAGKRSG